MPHIASQSGFEIIDHPADMGFRVWARTLPELFELAGATLSGILADIDSIEAVNQTSVEITGSDIDLLLYNWLSEILFIFDAEGILCSSFKVTMIDTGTGESKLAATLGGETYSSSKHQINTYVKAITLHQLKVEQNENRFQAQVYLDI